MLKAWLNLTAAFVLPPVSDSKLLAVNRGGGDKLSSSEHTLISWSSAAISSLLMSEMDGWSGFISTAGIAAVFVLFLLLLLLLPPHVGRQPLRASIRSAISNSCFGFTSRHSLIFKWFSIFVDILKLKLDRLDVYKY